MGAWLALGEVPAIRTTGMRSLAGIAGMLLILIPTFLHTRETPFPGLFAVPPCLGAAILLHVGHSGPNVATRLLSLRPVIFLGLISYSLYLWHWTVLELYGYYTQDAPKPWETAVLLTGSFLLAVVSWRWVELPFRSSRRGGVPLRTKPLLALSAAALGAVALLGIGLDAAKGRSQRYPETLIAQQRLSLRELWDDCLMDAKQDKKQNYSACVRGTADPIHVAVIGDSHALALLPGVVAQADAARQRVIFYGHGGCPPALGIERIDGHVRNCSAFVRWALARIDGEPQTRTVVFISRLPAYVEGSNFGPAERHLPAPAFASDKAVPVASNEALVSEGLLAAVSAVRRAGKRAVLVYPVPEVGRNVPNVLSREALLGRP